MSRIHAQQAFLSEKLLLLKQLDYTHAEPISHSFPKSVRNELELLDTIASVLTFGNGDTFAATLDKGDGSVKMILAKNGEPTRDDKCFAKEFFALIVEPEVNCAADAFPFLLKHRRAYLNIRIKKLHAISTDPKFIKDFHSGLDRYIAKAPDSSFRAQFPRGHSKLDKDRDLSSLLTEYLTKTQEYSGMELNESISGALDTFLNLNMFSETLAYSAFMQKLRGYGGQTNVGRRAGKFIRHAEKLGRYVRGIRCLIKHAKRLFPAGSTVPHRWVEGTFNGTGEGQVQFIATNPFEVACRMSPTYPLPTKHSENLDKLYPSNRQPWKPLSASLHPEVRIILSLLTPEERYGAVRPIGLSKQPCLCCVLWIKHVNMDTATYWVTSCLWGKADPSFALSGDAYPRAVGKSCDENSLDKWVEFNVYTKLMDELWGFLKRGYSTKFG